ncbi:MAG: hypothetical protein IJ955_05065 [Oscillospiraceae bacterium]|nr:hypothetical protein [Oscillospiraceae bacterium]
MSVNYQRLYAYLVGKIDDALTLLDTGDLLQVQRVRTILYDALQTAEEIYLDDTEDE